MTPTAPVPGILERVRRRTAPSRCFLDPFPSTARAVLLLGSARSGTTKVAESLAAASRTRFILEPFHTYWSPLPIGDFRWGSWRDPLDPVPELYGVWHSVLRGQVRSRRWLDKFNRSRVATRRV